MRFSLFITLLTVVLSPARAQQKPKILLLGVYHLNNPGLDVTQLSVDDVGSEKRQREIKALTRSIQAFNPTTIFIEAKPQRQPHFDSLYATYRTGGLRDRKNEIFQIAFSVANELGLAARQLRCVDSENDFPFDSLLAVAEISGQKRLIDTLLTNAAHHQTWFNTYLATHTIAQTFTALNTPEQYRTDMYQYTGLINQVGPRSNSVGSYIASEWWKRNITIQGNILRSLTPSDKRIMILYGSGHAAILDALFRLDPAYELVPVSRVLN